MEAMPLRLPLATVTRWAAWNGLDKGSCHWQPQPLRVEVPSRLRIAAPPNRLVIAHHTLLEARASQPAQKMDTLQPIASPRVLLIIYE